MSSTLSDESAFGTSAEAGATTQIEGEPNRGIPRWADAVIAALVLIAATPVLGVMAIAIVVTSGRPIFFRQRRVGRGFEPFMMIKLRTMIRASGGPKVTRKGDQRVTPIGRFLRKTKLDELPALWNVVRGDMALVGPRPEVPEYVNEADALWQKVLSVRPGMTDPVTILLRNEEELLASATDRSETYYVSELQPMKLHGYLEYLQRRTIGSDLVVLWDTFIAVIRKAT